MKNKFFCLFSKGKLCLLVMLTKAALNAVLIVLAADLLRTMVDDAAANGVAWFFRRNGGHLLLLLLIGVVNHLLDYWKEILFEGERYYVTHKIFCSILEMPYDAIMQKGTAEYFNLISSDLGLAAGVLRELDAVILQSARSLGAVIFIFSSEWRIGCGLLALGLVMILYNYFLSPVFGRIQQEIQADDCHVTDAAMQEYASHEYRHFYQFEPLKMKYERAYSEYIGSTLKKAGWRAGASVFDYLIGYLQIYLPLLLAATLIKGYTLGNVLALVANVSLFMGIFRSCGRMLTSVREGLAGVERILPVISRDGAGEGGTVLGKLPERILLQDLEYFYHNSAPGLAVKGACWNLEGNIGITGEKGSGKSTLLRILAGLLRNYQGSMTLDGIEAGKLSLGEEGVLACLPQDYPVFDMTILENFELMMPGKGEEEYLAYAALVNMDTEIRQMPEGLRTPVNSDRISSGQRQRLSLCMILMRETPLILLDEPTANLDEENRRIVKSLFRNFPQKRFFVVSHDHEIFDDSFRIHKICDGN